MKNPTPILLGSLGLTLLTTFATTAKANHLTGDKPLPEFLVTTDVNGDGNADLIVNLSGFDDLAILVGDGHGAFTLKRHLDTDTLPQNLAARDVDGDGRTDLVSVDEWGYDIRLYLGDGRGGFVFAKDFDAEGEADQIALEDMNNDGKLDLISNGPTEGVIRINLGDGKGNFESDAIELEDLNDNFALAIADVNNDGKKDIATTESDDALESKLVIFLNDGHGGFLDRKEFTVRSAASIVALSDLNGDGNLDAIVAGPGPGSFIGLAIATYLGDGAGNFSQKQVLALGKGSLNAGIALGDFNEDGNVDVAMPVPFNQSDTLSTSVLIFLGDGSGNLFRGTTITAGSQPDAAVVADFNHDGHQDLAVTNRHDATVSIHLGDGHGTFSTAATIPVDEVPTP